MKILLIRPPERSMQNTQTASYGLPLGIAYIAAVLKKSGYNAVIYDALNESPLSIGKKISVENPDIIGISNQFSIQLENAILVAQIAKDIKRDFLVIAGGSHPSSCPADFFSKTGCVDIVVIGEGEYAMLEIVEKIAKNQPWESIQGIAFKRNNEIAINPKRPPIQNLDELPYPAYELFNIENYFKLPGRSFDRPVFFYPGSERAMNIITSRGCPYNCVFCSIHATMGHVWRPQSPECVLKHIKFLARNYNIRHIHFEDDNLIFNKERFKRILDGIVEGRLNITWDTPNGIRADILDEEILRKAQKAGCIYLIMGVESGDPVVLRNIVQKQLSLKAVENAARLAKKVKLNLEAFFMIGFPGETIKNMKNTLTFAFKLQFKYGVYPILFIANPLPGTKLCELCHAEGYMPVKGTQRLYKYFLGIRAVISGVNFLRFCLFSPVFVTKKFIYLYKIFFLAPERIKFTPKIFLKNLIRYNFFCPKTI